MALATLFGGSNAYALPRYIITDLGALDGLTSDARAVSAGAYVAGSSSVGGNASTHAFRWSASDGMVDLGTLGGSNSQGFGVSASGDVVGQSALAGNGSVHAFYWSEAEGIRDLGTLGGNISQAFAVNDSGVVTGVSQSLTGRQAFVWDAVSGMRGIGSLSNVEDSLGLAINESGNVAGFSVPDSSIGQHAFFWSEVSGMRDLGTLGGLNSFGLGINDLDQVVGYSYVGGSDATSANEHAFLWTEGIGMIDLGTLSGVHSRAHDVNNSGIVVGSALVLEDSIASHAFVWDEESGMVDLTTLIDDLAGWVRINEAFGINDRGEIVGYGTSERGTHAFLLTPIETVPEPSSLLLALFGIGLAARHRASEVAVRAGDLDLLRKCPRSAL